ncbi:hypothetical protein B0H11DRAFT_1975462 [Mycena galericulata]|nr:hypothetical protein B0H11DRAFT_1975462 [Mycena galericulata]
MRFEVSQRLVDALIAAPSYTPRMPESLPVGMKQLLQSAKEYPEAFGCHVILGESLVGLVIALIQCKLSRAHNSLRDLEEMKSILLSKQTLYGIIAKSSDHCSTLPCDYDEDVADAFLVLLMIYDRTNQEAAAAWIERMYLPLIACLTTVRSSSLSEVVFL